jgi:hypothetical protein
VHDVRIDFMPVDRRTINVARSADEAARRPGRQVTGKAMDGRKKPSERKLPPRNCLKRALAASLPKAPRRAPRMKQSRRTDPPRHFGLRSLREQSGPPVVLSPSGS